MINLNLILLQCGDIEQNPGPYTTYIAGPLADLSLALATAPQGNVYFTKTQTGAITASASENSTILVNQGFGYSFVDGSVVYLQKGTVATSADIPWLHPYTVLTTTSANLWSSKLSLWIDAKESRSINANDEKLVSKDYTYNHGIIENTAQFKFTYANETIDMTNQSMLETSTNIQTTQYFKLGMVVEIPTQTVLNKTIFKHDDIEIKISQQTVADTTTQYCIGAYDNGSFLKGITFKPSDTTFKYSIYFDNSSNFIVSGNNANGSTGIFTGGTSAKVFINESSTQGVGNAQIKLHELLYYQSTANDITATSGNIIDYLNSRWGLTPYTDLHNIVPITVTWEILTNASHAGWGVFDPPNNGLQNIPPHSSYISLVSQGITVTQSGKKLSYSSSTRAREFPIPMGISTPIHVKNSFTNDSKYYVEFNFYMAANNQANGGIGFCSSSHTTWSSASDINSEQNHSHFFFCHRLFGSNWNTNAGQIYYKNSVSALNAVGTPAMSIPDMTTGTVKLGMSLDFTHTEHIYFTVYFNGNQVYAPQLLTFSDMYNNSTSDHELVPCVYHYSSGQYDWEYLPELSASHIPAGHTYIV